MADGEILAIRGPNGIGKTTTMRMLQDIINRIEAILPFSEPDPINTQQVKALLLAMRRERLAILMSTHMMHSIRWWRTAC